MEKMTFIFLVIIVAYLIIAFIKSRVKKEDNKQKETRSAPLEMPVGKEESSDTERAAIAAVIAAVMGEAAYVVKRVYAVATVDESRSNWRTAGRTEIMTKKLF